MFLWTAFTIGLFGSLHCVGMCGPIALTIGKGSSLESLKHAFLYNAGRTATYAIMGGMIGLLGKGIALAGFQKYMTLALGIMLLLVAVFSINVEARLLKITAMDQFVFRLKGWIGRWIRKQGNSASLFVGSLNGLLPCGLVYMAIVGALSTGEWYNGMAYMVLFGLGTLPLMTLTILAGGLAGIRIRSFLRKVYPLFLVVFAVLFISRGLNFHIPGDFFFWEKMGDMPMCH